MSAIAKLNTVVRDGLANDNIAKVMKGQMGNIVSKKLSFIVLY